MAILFNNEPQEYHQDTSQASKTLAKVPSSSVEITIRTMASDIEMLGQGGGVLPAQQAIKIAMPEQYTKADSTMLSTTNPQSDDAVELPAKKRNLTLIITAVIAVPVLFLVGFFIYPALSPQSPVAPSPSPLPAPAPMPPSVAPTPPPLAPPPAPPVATHQSFFRGTLDGTASFTVQPSAGLTMSGQLPMLLQASPSGFFEVVLHGVDGKTPTPSEWFTALGASIIDPYILSNNFISDFTAFLYKDAGGVWPGYAIKLQPEKSPLLLRSDVARLESAASSLSAFFTTPPGTALGGFKDKLLNGQPVRELQFSAGGAVFVYGWINNQYLLIGTSEDGWKQAAARL